MTAEPTTAEPTTEEPTTAEPTASPAFAVSDEAVTIDEDNKQITIPADTSAEAFAAMIASGSAKVVSAEGEELEADALIGTGCKIQTLDEGGNVISEYIVIVPSDIDGNGKITASDARLALRCAAKLDTLEGVYVLAADADSDGAVKPADARKVLRKAAKLECLSRLTIKIPDFMPVIFIILLANIPISWVRLNWRSAKERRDVKDGESNSIQNQRTLLTKYATDHGYTNLKIPVDDGYTGTNFDCSEQAKKRLSDLDLIISRLYEDNVLENLSMK